MADTTYKAVIDGHELPFPESGRPFEWVVAAGFGPIVQAWEVPTDIAALIVPSKLGQEVSLRLGDDEDGIDAYRVIVLRTAPSGDPTTVMILMVNVLWYLEHAHFVMDVNGRRRVGDTRLIGNTLTPDSTVVPNVAYVAWQINNGVPYKWTTLKDQVLTALTEARHGRPEIFWRSDDLVQILGGLDNIVESRSADSPGTVGLARAIESTPGMGLYVGLDGALITFDASPGSEDKIIKQLPKPLLTNGSLVWVDMRALRPVPSDNSWRVYLDFEFELRLTYNVSGVGIGAQVDVSYPRLEPVVQVVVNSLVIPGPGGRTVGQGTWITQNEFYRAVGAVVVGPAGHTLTLPQLTDDIVARHWFGDAVMRYCEGGSAPEQNIDPLMVIQMQELMRAFRTCFRINPQLWKNIRGAWEVRAAVWDPATGTRAPSPVYSNFNVTPLDKWAAANVTMFGKNVLTSYPGSGLLVDGHPSGFRVKIVDFDQGIIEIERSLGKFPGHTRIAPSPVIKLAKIDDATLREACRQQLILATSGGTDAWKLATVISVSPGAPNDQRRLYEVKVSFADAVTAAGLSPTMGITGTGPDHERRSMLTKARVAWQDDSDTSERILSGVAAFDTGGEIRNNDPPDAQNPQLLVPVNLQQEVKPVAKAVAAADLLARLDHWEGTLRVPMNGNLVPLGTIKKVTHQVFEDAAWSVIDCTPNPEPFAALDFLPASAREFVLKELGGAGR